VVWKFTEKQEHPSRTTKTSADFIQTVYPQIGAVVIGRCSTMPTSTAQEL
jgi:hypothetical protein